MKLKRQSNYCKFNKPLTFLWYIENDNTFKLFLKTDYELTLDDYLVLKSNSKAISSEI